MRLRDVRRTTDEIDDAFEALQEERYGDGGVEDELPPAVHPQDDRPAATAAALSSAGMSVFGIIG